MVLLNTKDFIINGYGGYAAADVNVFGWGMLAVCVVAVVIFTSMKGKEGYADLHKIAAKEDK